jgi:hypothetical protein
MCTAYAIAVKFKTNHIVWCHFLLFLNVSVKHLSKHEKTSIAHVYIEEAVNVSIDDNLPHKTLHYVVSKFTKDIVYSNPPS